MPDEILDDISFDDDGYINDDELEKYLHTFIQKRSESYIEYWKNEESASFDWLKMMMGLPWLLYRKMYWVFFAFFVISFFLLGWKHLFFIVPGFALVYCLVNFSILESIDIWIKLGGMFPVLIICGFYSKKVYLSHAKVRINIQKERHGYHKLNHHLMKDGGVEGAIPAIILLALFLHMFSSLGAGMNTILTF